MKIAVSRKGRANLEFVQAAAHFHVSFLNENMTIALNITNWIITSFFVYTGLFTFYDLYFPKEAYQCATLPMSFLMVVSFPLSILVLIISFFEIRKLLRHEWLIKRWQRNAYWGKAVISSVVAIAVIVFIIGLTIGGLVSSIC